MEPRKPTAERIRPILEAMERSIDSARRKRTHGEEPRRLHRDETASEIAARRHSYGDGPANPIASIPKAQPHQSPASEDSCADDPLRTETGERLKAKPKRPQNFGPSHAQQLPPYHSRAS